MTQTGNSSRRMPRMARPPTGILRTKSLDESLSGSSRDEQSSPRIRRNVSFDTTEIRTYPRLLDKSQDGPALSIGWKPVETEITTVQERYFERSYNTRGEIRPLRVEQRIDILLDAGYSKKEIIRHLAGVSILELKHQPKPQPLKTKSVTHKLKKIASKMTVFPATA